MLRPLILTTSLAFSCMLSAQSNLVFSIPSEYDFSVSINAHRPTKPHPWQTKFENIAEGDITIKVIASKPGTTYRLEQTFTKKVERGYEFIYFIIPYQSSLECRLANSYTLEQINGSSKYGDEDPYGSSTSRVKTYKGKPVISVKEAETFIASVNKNFSMEDKIKFIKTYLPGFYIYTDDVVRLLRLLFSDEEKADVAKYAYDHTIDNHFYYKIRSSFFSASVYEDVEKYVAERNGDRK